MRLARSGGPHEGLRGPSRKGRAPEPDPPAFHVPCNGGCVKAKIDAKDAAALVQVRSDLKQRMAKASLEWGKAWKDSLDQEQLVLLHAVAIHELNTSSFLVLLENFMGVRLHPGFQGGFLGTMQEAVDFIRGEEDP